jgi:hypothetical protein
MSAGTQHGAMSLRRMAFKTVAWKCVGLASLAIAKQWESMWGRSARPKRHIHLVIVLALAQADFNLQISTDVPLTADWIRLRSPCVTVLSFIRTI